MRSTMFLCALLALSACGGSTTEAEEPPPDEPVEPRDELPVDTETAERPSMTAEECEAAGGSVVGDIGDGAIHRPEYVCPSGQPPVGSIPLGVEGSVCCNP